MPVYDADAPKVVCAGHKMQVIQVSGRFIQQARDIRAERDKRFSNIFVEEETDERWVGDLGEVVFDYWLHGNGVKEIEWIKDKVAGRPDFIIAGKHRIGVKTVKRVAAPMEHYTAQITAKHIKEPVDYFFFMSYQIGAKNMWLLGGIERDLFEMKAKYYGAGDQVHRDYTIRKGHAIYNIEINKLVKPALWLNLINPPPPSPSLPPHWITPPKKGQQSLF